MTIGTTYRIGCCFLLAAASGWADARADAWTILQSGLSKGGSRAQAVEALGSTGLNPRAADIARNALRDKDARVRRAAATALGEMGCRAAIPELRQALDDSNGEVNFAAARALAELGDPGGEALFAKLLSGQRKEAPGITQDAMHELTQRVRNPGMLALAGVGHAATGATPFLAPAAVGVWFTERALKDNGAPGRIAAATYLAHDSSAYAATLLEYALRDSNWAVRAAAVKALGERGDPTVIGNLEPVLKDGNPTVKYLAAATIVRLGDQPAVRQ